MWRSPLYCVLFVTLIFITSFSSVLRADIYEWEWVDPSDHSKGKQQSTVLCPDGKSNIYIYTYPRHLDLTKAYLIGFDLSGTLFQDAILTNADMTGATIAGVSFCSTTDRGFTRAQFESTASYVTGELSGIGMQENNLSGWNFAGKNLSKASFKEATLSGTDFTGSAITGGNFSETTDKGFTQSQFESTASYTSDELTGVDLSKNNLMGWNFASKNLTGAKFIQSKLRGVDFTNANLTNASFIHADLVRDFFSGCDEANFSGATITGADFSTSGSYGISRTQFESTASYSSGDLREIKLQRKNLAAWNFAGKNLRNADFENATLTNADFSGATIVGTNFSSTTDSNFTQEQFESTASYNSGDLTGVDLSQNDLTHWNFSEKDLSGANLTGSTLTAADFSGAIIEKAYLFGATNYGFTREQFESTASYTTGKLTGIWLCGSDLTNWNFAGKNLTDANFSYAKLSNADFSGATISGASFGSTAERDLTTDQGFTQEQLESTSSYATGDLSGIWLSYNTLIGWNLAEKNLTDACFFEACLIDVNLNRANLTDASFSYAWIHNTNLTGINLTGVSFHGAYLWGVDTRGANNLWHYDITSNSNYIGSDGHIKELDITRRDRFRIWDYDGLDTDDDGTPDKMLGITVEDWFVIDETSMLIIGLEDEEWGSTIEFEGGIDVCFDGTLEVELRDGFVPVGGDEWQLFDFDGVMPVGVFHSFVLPDVVGCAWDTSRLMNDGVLSITAVPEPSTIILLLIGTLGCLILKQTTQRISERRSTP